MSSLTRALLPAALIASTALLGGCVEPFHGAVIQMNFGTLIPDNAPGEHYQLFFEVNGAVVPGPRFKVLDPVSECDTPQALVPVGLRVVQNYRLGFDQETICSEGQRVGQLDLIDLASASLVGGVRVDTAADVSHATAVFISVEVDDDSDDRPSDRYAVAAELGDGRDPEKDRRLEATAALCEENPEALGPDGCSEEALTPLRTRRGVRLGSFVPLGGGPIWGEIAVVPAKDGATF
ncbi:MAG: hypothetical protein ACE366_31335 [Bradymonadia bacterium]